MSISFWERQTFFNRPDVVIIGSGIVGLSSALRLKEKHPAMKVLVLERGFLPSGASSKNAGFACFGSTSELLSDLERHSEDEVFALVRKRWEGLKRLRQTLGDRNIDLQNHGGYEVFDDAEKFSVCADRLPYLNKQLSDIVGVSSVCRTANDMIPEFGFRGFSHMILNKAESQIDTGMMISSLIRKVRDAGVEILNGIEVRSITAAGSDVMITTAHDFEFRCGKVIIATNGFAKKFLPHFDVEPARAQVLITEPVNDLRLKGTFHYDSGFYYFRNINGRVLLGGGRNLDLKGENTTEFGLTTLIQNKLDGLLKERILPYTNYKVDMRWSGIMGVGGQKSSIVKAVQPNIFCAVRMGGMGVAIGSLVGEEAALLCMES